MSKRLVNYQYDHTNSSQKHTNMIVAYVKAASSGEFAADAPLGLPASYVYIGMIDQSDCLCMHGTQTGWCRFTHTFYNNGSHTDTTKEHLVILTPGTMRFFASMMMPWKI